MLKELFRKMLERRNYEVKFQGKNIKDLKFIKFPKL